MASSRLDIHAFGAHTQDKAEDIDFGNPQPISESGGHRDRGD